MEPVNGAHDQSSQFQANDPRAEAAMDAARTRVVVWQQRANM